MTDPTPTPAPPRRRPVMRGQTSGLCLLLSLLFAFWALAPHNVHLEIQQPAVTVTTHR